MSYFSAKNAPRKKQGEPLAPSFRAAAASGTTLEDLQKSAQKLAPRIKARSQAAQASFNSWLYELRLGHSLLFFGYGSRRAILNKFGADACVDGAVIAVNCTAQYLTLRTLLQKIVTVQRASCSTTSRASGDARGLLQTITQESGRQRLYLILHGIDSPGASSLQEDSEKRRVPNVGPKSDPDNAVLRGPETQAMIAEIAALPKVHLVASARHVNALLLWDRKVAARFQWLFHHLPTFEPWVLEATKCRPLLQMTRVEARKQGSAAVLQALVARERKIFEILAQHQLDVGDEGMTVRDLFEACRSRFLVSTEVMLSHHLGELKDHKLVLQRSSADGTDVLYIPMDEDSILEILSTLEGGNDVPAGQP